MKITTTIILTLAYLTTFASDSGSLKSLDSFIKECMLEYRIPGLSIAVVEKDSVILLRGYGISDPTRRKVTKDTPFFLGSVSKSITAFAVLKLVETGHLDLDIPIIKYIPWFSLEGNLSNSNSSDYITLRHLLNQTSGISQATGQKALPINYDNSDALENQVRSFSDISLVHEVGTQFEYANANYQIAGLVVQIVSGQSIEDFIHDNIFMPHNMRNSFTSPKPARDAGLATGYRWWFGYPVPFSKQPFPRASIPSGHIISTAEDLSHYLITQMNEGTYQDTSILSSEFISILHEPKLNNYAMGWFVHQNEVIEHGGHLECFGAHLYIDLKNDRGIALLINSNRGLGGGHIGQMAPTIARLMSGESVYIPLVDKANRNSLLQLVLVFLIVAIWLSWSFLQILKWSKIKQVVFHRQKLKLLLFIPLLLEGVLVIILFKVIPTYISVAFLNSPDIMLTWLLILFTLVVWSLIRTIWIIRLSYLAKKH